MKLHKIASGNSIEMQNPLRAKIQTNILVLTKMQGGKEIAHNGSNSGYQKSLFL